MKDLRHNFKNTAMGVKRLLLCVQSMPFSLTRTPLSWPQGAFDAVVGPQQSFCMCGKAVATRYSRKLHLDWCSNSIHSGRVRSLLSPSFKPRVNAPRVHQPFLVGSHRKEEVCPPADEPFCVGQRVLPVLVVGSPAYGAVASAPLTGIPRSDEWSHWGMPVSMSPRATSDAAAIV